MNQSSLRITRYLIVSILTLISPSSSIVPETAFGQSENRAREQWQTIPQLQHGQRELARPKPAWSRWMTHRGNHLIAIDDSAVQTELFELTSTADQQRTLDILRRYRKELRIVASGIRYDAIDKQEEKRIAGALSDLNQRTESELQSMLPIEVWRRLDQLILWMRIRDQGLIKCLISCFGGDISYASKLPNLTTSQLRSLQDQAPSWQLEYTCELYLLEDFVIRKFAKELDASQQRTLELCLGHSYAKRSRLTTGRLAESDIKQIAVDASTPSHLSLPPASTRVLLSSLEYPNDFLDRHADPGIHRYPWRDFYLPTYESKSILSGDHVAIAQANDMIELSASQQQRLQALVEQKQRKMLRLKQRFPRWNDRDSGQRDGFIFEYRKLEDGQREQLYSKILLPHQSELLKAYLYTRLLRRHGVLPMLADGSLGRELEITRDQRNAIFECAPQIREELRIELEKIYRRLHNDVLSVLTAKQRRRIQSVLGDVPSFHLQGEFVDTLRHLTSFAKAE